MKWHFVNKKFGFVIYFEEICYHPNGFAHRGINKLNPGYPGQNMKQNGKY